MILDSNESADGPWDGLERIVARTVGPDKGLGSVLPTGYGTRGEAGKDRGCGMVDLERVAGYKADRGTPERPAYSDHNVA